MRNVSFVHKHTSPLLFKDSKKNFFPLFISVYKGFTVQTSEKSVLIKKHIEAFFLKRYNFE